MIEERWLDVRARVADSAIRAERDPEDVCIVAVSKTFGSDVIADAVAAGVTDLGENRAQELKLKHAALGDRARWHFIGHLQSNKVRAVVGVASLIHSVDRIGIAEAIARRATSLGIRQEVLIEVNVSGESTKQGVEPARAIPLCEEAAALDGIAVRGLMTMPPLPSRPEDSSPYYRQLRELGQAVQARSPEATLLSMGTTRDLEVAVLEGATHVRVGEAIFGPRSRTPTQL
jgi:pyridoxal phosphate enzyme (YggS family)